ncbi:HAD-IA family hydrolase [Auraticoccus sp. F435]|uniref:HAD-IA family hydrolase n=2 Tax=Auraticoccus cholistanensis TaxID=2656650 RepID=A0A6A9V090_9ACTN|nr:HAD-IA family hydrolase [Auraticoccus cholistanensis]MVA75179.1 HAD-IA family hydrolase [Auraticoccus cholistanensis]
MDGTLVDSTPAVVRAWTTWAEEHGITAEQLAGNHGMPAASIIARLLPDAERERALARIVELETTDVGGVVPLPGTVETLTVLPRERVAIATSCTRPLAEVRIGASEIPRPEVVVTVDDVERGKPAPDPFLAAARDLGFPPERCLVVEDAPAGLSAARAAGCATLAVTTTTPRAELEADLVVGTLADVRWHVRDGGIEVALAD